MTRAEIGFEFMLNALRLSEGVPASLFAERAGFPLAIVQRELAEASRRGLIDADPSAIRPTALGRRFLNDLQTMFLRDPSTPAPAASAVRAVRGPRAGSVT